MIIPFASVRQQPPKPVFPTVRDARLALASDRLGTVYQTARSVYVVTAHGSGTFTREQWEVEANP